DAGRPCKACLRAHAVVVANLVKRGLPLDSVQPECVYDCDSDSEHSSPTQSASSPVQPPPEPQDFQPRTPIHQEQFPQQTVYDNPLFTTPSPTDSLYLSLDSNTYRTALPMTDTSPQTSPFYDSIAVLPGYCYLPPQMSQSYQFAQLSPRLFGNDLPQLNYHQLEWMCQSPQIATPYSQASDCDASPLMWSRQLQ
ncbi:hypothetical protein FRC12_016898, partial [Ceratobasidium sp. 428]